MSREDVVDLTKILNSPKPDARKVVENLYKKAVEDVSLKPFVPGKDDLVNHPDLELALEVAKANKLL